MWAACARRCSHSVAHAFHVGCAFLDHIVHDILLLLCHVFVCCQKLAARKDMTKQGQHAMRSVIEESAVDMERMSDAVAAASVRATMQTRARLGNKHGVRRPGTRE